MPTKAQIVDAVGTWLAAGPGMLSVTHVAGERVTWSSGAAYPDQAHFSIDAAIDTGNPYWLACRALCDIDDPLAPHYSEDALSINEAPAAVTLRFAIDDHSGRGWIMTTSSERSLIAFDVLPRAVDGLPELCSPVMLLGRSVGGAAYRVDETGTRQGFAEFNLVTPVGAVPWYGSTLTAPPAAPQKLVLPLVPQSFDFISALGPSGIYAAPLGTGWAGDEVLAAWPQHLVRYYAGPGAVLVAPTDENWDTL